MHPSFVSLLSFLFLFFICAINKSTSAIHSWTVTDYETTCRQMGFTGGRYVQWMDRVNSSSSRPLLLEYPRCHPGASSLLQCDDWNSRRLGAGVCGELSLFVFAYPVVVVVVKVFLEFGFFSDRLLLR